jgi:hypothetical protein
LDEDDATNEEDDQGVSRAQVREHGSKVVELARRHGFAEFDSDRADNRVYEDEQILDLFSNACLTQGSAHSEGEAGWFLDENDVCDDSTFLRVIKQFATPPGEEVSASVQELQIKDIVAFTELYQETVMAAFDAATENILTTIRHEDPFDDRHVVAGTRTTVKSSTATRSRRSRSSGTTCRSSWGSNRSRNAPSGNRKTRRPIRRQK